MKISVRFDNESKKRVRKILREFAMYKTHIELSQNDKTYNEQIQSLEYAFSVVLSRLEHLNKNGRTDDVVQLAKKNY